MRLFKTRALAAEAVKGGRVHVNGVAVKPGREVGPGDELELTFGPVRRTVIARAAANRRVSAAEAANLYDETKESVAERERQAELRRLSGPVDLGGRPPSATAAASRLASASDPGASDLADLGGDTGSH